MSVFLNLSTNNILVEYIYGDLDNASKIGTDDAGFYLMDNEHNKERYVMNSDDSVNITSNTRDRSITSIDPQNIKLGLLTTNKLGPALNDADPKLTDTPDLPLTFGNQEGINYDTVRVHFIQGFTFDDAYDGVFINIKTRDKQDVKINLLSGVFTFEDKWITLNGTPILYGGRQYSTYIEFKVPSLQFLKNSYTTEFVQGGLSDILAYKITNGVGFYDTSNIEIQAGMLSTFSQSNTQIISTIQLSEATTLPSSNEFNEVGVFINDSDNGDYIEFYGLYNGEIFGDYMDGLNNSGSTYIAIHDLIVYEQLPSIIENFDLKGYYKPTTNVPALSTLAYIQNFKDGDHWIATETAFSSSLGLNINKGDFLIYDSSIPEPIKIRKVENDGSDFQNVSNFVRTADISYVQDSDYQEPNRFRPVLKYGGIALSYRIDYTLKILNVNTNAITDVRGSYVSFEPEKYGQELIKINVADNILSFDVYNKKIINMINQNNLSNNTQNNITNTDLYSKSITSFKETLNISASTKTVIIDENNNIVDKNSSNTQEINGQGTGRLYITPFDTFVQFNMYELSDSEVVGFNLSKVGEIFLNFEIGNGEIIKLPSYPNDSVKSERGQVLFKVSRSIYNQIAKLEDNNFYISTQVGSNTAETLLYAGKFFDTTQQITDIQANIVANLNSKIQELQTIRQEQTDVIEQQAAALAAANEEVDTLDNRLEREVARRVKAIDRLRKRQQGLTAGRGRGTEKSTSVKSSNFNNFGNRAGTTGSRRGSTARRRTRGGTSR